MDLHRFFIMDIWVTPPVTIVFCVWNRLLADDGAHLAQFGHTFDQVLLVSGDELKVGTPCVEGASVVATVVKNGKGKKIDVIKYKAKKNEKKKIGHRQDYSKIQIVKIEG